MKQVRINTLRGYEEVENYYYVVDNGDVITKSRRPRTLSPMMTKKGYLKVDLQKRDGGNKASMVHRLVALAFVGNLDYHLYPQVNHINGDKRDNRSSNLEWADNLYNSLHARELGNWDPEKYPKPITAIDIRTKIKRHFPSIYQAAVWIGNVDCRSNIRKCLNGEISQVYGQIWEYRNLMEVNNG